MTRGPGNRIWRMLAPAVPGLVLGLLLPATPAVAQDAVGSTGWPGLERASWNASRFQAGDPTRRAELPPRVIQAAGGAAGWFVGAFSTAFVTGISSGCILSDDPDSGVCSGVRTATLVGAGALSALFVEALGRDRRNEPALLEVLAGSAAGLGLAAVTGATSGGSGALDFDVPVVFSLQVGGALLGDYWASRSQR